MICELRDNGNEVVLSHVTVGDILTLTKLLFQKDKEVVFTRPTEEQKGRNKNKEEQ